MPYSIMDQVASDIDRAGYDTADLMISPIVAKMQVRLLQEDPWLYHAMYKEKFKRTKISALITDQFSLLEQPEPRAIIRLWFEVAQRTTGLKRYFSFSNTRNELDRSFDWIESMARGIGTEFQPCICYYPSPRTTDAYYADLTKRLLKYKPDALWLKDAGGLLTAERIKTLLPAIQKEAGDIPIDIHTHGMSANQGQVVAEAIRLGVDSVHTCIPPLASGYSHISIHSAMNSARILGRDFSPMDTEALEIVEERLTRHAQLEGKPIGAPLEYDPSVFLHQVPGGVISNMKAQLTQMGIGDKLQEVLEEVVRIIEDLGRPIMITPSSQFIVSQAAVNVATGERYKEVLDCMIETALGVWGWEDAGVPWMKAEVKDRFLSHPNARSLEERYKRNQELAAEEGNLKKLRASYGMTNATDEDFLLYHIMRGDSEIKQIKTPRPHYTGREPLIALLEQLKRDHDISRLELRKGKTTFSYARG